MRLFETGFRIFISAMVISESAVDLGQKISQTEVHMMRKVRLDLFSKTHKPKLEDFLQMNLYINTRKTILFSYFPSSFFRKLDYVYDWKPPRIPSSVSNKKYNLYSKVFFKVISYPNMKIRK